MAGSDVKVPIGDAIPATAEPNPLLKFEPNAHPDVGTSAPAPTAAAPAPAPALAPDPLTPTIDPVNEAPAPDAPIDVTNPPVELPGVKIASQVAGTGIGTAVGAAAGGGILSVPAAVVGGVGGAAAGTAFYDVLQNLVDSINGTKNEQGQPITLSQQTIDMLSNGFISAGAEGANAVTKTMMEGVKSQILKGTVRIGSGGVGAALATLTAGQAAALGKVWGLIPPNQRTPDLYDSVRDAVANGGLDMVVNTALHTTLPAKAVVKLLANGVFGINHEQVEAAALAARYGINLSMDILDPTGRANLYKKIASIVPLIAAPYKNLYNKNVDAINTYTAGLAGQVSTSGMSIPQAGRQASDIANSTYEKFIGVYNTQRNELIAKARTAGVTFSTDSKVGIDQAGNPVAGLRTQANNYVKGIQQTNIPSVAKGIISLPTKGKTNLLSTNKDLLAFSNKILNMPQYATLGQLNGVGKDIEVLSKKYADDPEAMSVLNGFSDSLHGALTDSNAPGASHPDVGGQFLALDQANASTKAAFQTKTAGKLLANNSPDTIGNAIFAMDSPDQVQELRSIIGDKAVNDGTAAFLQHAVALSNKGVGPQQTFNVDTFAKQLGLDDPGSPRYEAVQSALSTSGIKIEDLTNFVKSARYVYQSPPNDTATMVARKMTLGGFRSVIGLMVPGLGAALGHSFLGAGTGEVATISSMLLGWKGSQILSNPAYLKDMSTFLDHSAGLAQRRMALMRVAQAVLPDDVTGRATSPVTDPNQQRGASGKFPPPHSGFLQQMFQ